MVHVRRLHEKYGERAQFLFIYVAEAGHELPEELRPFAEPPGAPPGSRLRLLPRVRAGRKHFDLRFPCLIDNEQGEVQNRFNGYPTRLAIVDSAGCLALDSGPLTSDFFPQKRIDDWFERYATLPFPRSTKRD